jgi:hypothetical protein
MVVHIAGKALRRQKFIRRQQVSFENQPIRLRRTSPPIFTRQAAIEQLVLRLAVL